MWSIVRSRLTIRAERRAALHASLEGHRRHRVHTPVKMLHTRPEPDGRT